MNRKKRTELYEMISEKILDSSDLSSDIEDLYDSMGSAVSPEMEQLLKGLAALQSGVTDKIIVQRGTTDLGDDAEDMYGDGDQSPLYSPEAEKLQFEWSMGSDYNPSVHPYHSEWCRACFNGDIVRVRELIDNASTPENLARLLEKRESGLRFSGIFHVIAGARFHHDKMQKYISIAQLLIEAGANINAKDVAGYSPLHHCLTRVGNTTSFHIAQKLIEAGAEVNSTNRFGSTALVEPVMNCNYEAIKLLLDHGCDPGIRDNNGIRCSDLAVHNPMIASMLSRSYRRRAQGEREIAGRCGTCGVRGVFRYCTGCYMVRYCSTTCQRSNWKDHKNPCKEHQKQNVVKTTPAYDPGDGSGGEIFWFNEKSKKKWMSKYKPSIHEGKQKTMRVKLQISCNEPRGASILIYNKERDYEKYILSSADTIPSDAGYERIYDAVEEKGYGGKKVYFGATLKSEGHLYINIGVAFPDTF